jgi:hypothetical protein
VATVYIRQMAKGKTVRLIMIVPEDLLTEVDDFRFATRQPSRMAAVRELLEEGLKAKGITSPSSAGPAKKPGARAKKP